ncbi:hypothetical protein [Chthonobacter rhizosphaerae]|uniref:hypothetical protein n=1 Tax=Chthonobacter rhizosphaerae TaxID=2735553 RepID=UPI0015EED854|nr:hypothetical protein [Chthonobacter rhizosphaerae]
MRAVGRVFATMIGFLAAIATAAAFFVAVKVGVEPASAETAGWFWGQFALYGGLTAAVVGSMAFVPAVILALVTEVLGIRSVIVHAGAWGLMGLAAATAFGGLQAGDTTLEADGSILMATGFVAGLVYWVVAGRNAGLMPAEPPPRRLDGSVKAPETGASKTGAPDRAA